MVNLEKRVNELERQVRELTRLLTQAGERLAKPLVPQNGNYLGVLDGNLNQGTSATVSIYEYDPDAATPEESWIDTGTNITGVRDFFFNDDETAEAGTKVEVFWYINTWVARVIYCAVSDNHGAPEE